MECGSGNYLDLMKNYPIVCAAFRRLEPQYQDVITDICRRMGEGMAEFIEKDVRGGCKWRAGGAAARQGRLGPWWCLARRAGVGGAGFRAGWSRSGRGIGATGPAVDAPREQHPHPHPLDCPPPDPRRSRPSRITTSTVTTWPDWWASVCPSCLPALVGGGDPGWGSGPKGCWGLRQGASVTDGGAGEWGSEALTGMPTGGRHVPGRTSPPNPPRSTRRAGLEGKEFEDLDTLSNGMGLFLQKTNIIRDYLVSGGGAGDPGLCGAALQGNARLACA